MTNLATNNKGRILLLNFSPWMLAIACTLLLLLLAVFTVSNYQREKELMGQALEQKGLTLMRFINSAAREAMRDNMRSSETFVRWEDQVRPAMEQAVEQPGVKAVMLLDQQGTIVAGAGEDFDSGTVDQATLTLVRSLQPGKEKPFVTRIFKETHDGTTNQRFQIAAWHLSPAIPGAPDHFDRGPGRGPMMRRFANSPHYAAMQEELRRLMDKQLIFVVQLDFEQFNSSLKRQLFQIIILSIVTLLVGIGGALSYMTLSGLKGSQQSLGEMRAFTDILISALSVGLIATDNQGVVRVCNSAAGNILGVETDRLKGKIPDVCLPASLTRMFNGDTQMNSSERQKEIVLDHDPKNPISLHVASMVVLDHDDRFAGEVLLIRDLTSVKLLEKELQRSERLAALGKMAAGVAHELRNPLSSIKGLAILLKSQLSASGSGGETAEILIKEVERLNRSISELLDYAKPGQLKREATSINEIIQKVVSLVLVDAESYNISVSLQLAEDLPVVQVDADKINQVLLNLLLNAIQAMPNGGDLLVRTEVDGEMLAMSIRDNGVGIAPENLTKVFDPYFTTKSNGTGLGLSLSVKIVEEHGGTIKIFSTQNAFTEVKVALPLEAHCS